MGKVIGIDLGTTNSCVSAMDDGRPIVIPSKAGYRTTPSVFAVTEKDKKLVGHLAKRQAITNPKNTIYSAKRLIGRRFSSPEVKKATKTYSYQITKGPHDDVRVISGGKEYSLPEISAMILLEMKRIAEEYLREKVTEAVITVPAYFNDNQRQATKDAGIVAGLEVLRIINEPTAAALAYGMIKKRREERIAVYDLGGGTFDISILELGAGVFEVISTAGDTYLGGEDFDTGIMDYLVEEFSGSTGINLSDDRMALQRLSDAAEKAKCELSAVKEAQINLPFIASDTRGPKHLDLRLTREKLAELTKDIVERTIKICEETIQQAKLNKKDINEVILVGGQTRSPLVQEMVRNFFGKQPHKGVHPDEVVAIGAAVQAAALTEEKTELLLLDVTPLSLGIATHGGFFTPLIERNTTVPVRKSHIFTTARDDQTTVKIRVLQGESDRADDNELLGEFMLSGIRKAKKGEPEIDVSFDINADGIVNVSAKDLETKKEQSITVTASSGLTEDEVRQMAEEAQMYELELKQ
ncbi:MAG: molecular chaperone DnaK [Deltaproteobacteria bacterium]|nr:MAG: molecular chaperone DnaK [Deltaproteobacteria bacterium]